VTQSDVYDWLLERKVREPACLMLGKRCVVGRWIDTMELLGTGYVCRIGRVGIQVLGEGATWKAAHKAAKARLV
jgi:hypothetical protein